MSTTKTANWLLGGMISVLIAATLVYLNPPTPGRAFTKNQSTPPSQEQTSGANHKRTGSDFNW